MKWYHKAILKPFQWLYAIGVFIRNFFFDYLWKPKQFPVRIISLGNLNVGGSGKTPMAEFLMTKSLQENVNVAYLSRGYGRKTKGFLLVNHQEHSSLEVGDEALQVASNFPNCPVAVCENRVKGVEMLLKQFPDLQLVILDDAFQHRKIHRDLDIIMLNVSKNPFVDSLLPIGRLREPVSSLKRCNLVVFSKANLASESEIRILKSKISKPRASTNLVSVALINCFEDKEFPLEQTNRYPVYSVSAVGNNELFIKQLFATNLNVIGTSSFRDHYMIQESDLKKVVKKCKKLAKDNSLGRPPIIVLTEKDYYRLKNQPYFQKQEIDFYYLKVAFELQEPCPKIEDFFSKLKN